MQSEAGAAGTLHGALQKGAFATTFTASQGLLLMVPNMFKIAGELTPCVMHVAARTIATHALSIFGDHSDVMHVRTTGWAMLAAGSVQEAHDFAAVAHAATLRSRVPFVHFFDGFRTSHEVDKIAVLDDADLRALVDDDAVLAHRGAGPHARRARSCAARRRTPTCSSRLARRPTRSTTRCPASSRTCSASWPIAAAARYGLVDYVGAPDADRVVVLMGSGAGAAEEAVEALTAAGERVGLLKVRLYRPFPTDAPRAGPAADGALHRRARPHQGAGRHRRAAPPRRHRHPPRRHGHRRAAVRAGAARDRRALRPVVEGVPPGPRQARSSTSWPASTRRRDGRRSGASRSASATTSRGLSLDGDDDFRYPRPAGEVQAMFFGLGADGTVGANKASVKIIGEHTDLFAQGYFVYDSKKSGSVTVSHLRFGPEPIRSTYLIEDADFVACHQFGLLEKMPVLDHAKHGRHVPAQQPVPGRRGVGPAARGGAGPDRRQGPRGVGDRRPPRRQGERARRPDQHRDAAVLLRPRRRDPRRRGHRPHQGLGASKPTARAARPSSSATTRRSTPRSPRSPVSRCPPRRRPQRSLRNVAARRRARLRRPGHGPADGRRGRPAAGVGAPRRRHVPDRHRPVREAGHRPGDPDLGPRHLHRLRQVRHRLPARDDPDEGVRAVSARRRAVVVPVQGVPLQGHLRLPHDDPGRARRLHRLRGLRRRVPGEVEDRGAPQGDQHGAGAGPPRRRTAGVGLLPVHPRARPRPAAARLGEGLAGAAAAVRVLRRLRRLRRDAVHQAGHAAVRRPHGRGQRHRLLVDLRRQPADDAVDGRTPRAAARRGATRCSRTTPSSGSGCASAWRRRRRWRPRCSTSSATPSGPTSSSRSSPPIRSPRPASAPSASGSPRSATRCGRSPPPTAPTARPPATCWRSPAA